MISSLKTKAYPFRFSFPYILRASDCSPRCMRSGIHNLEIRAGIKATGFPLFEPSSEGTTKIQGSCGDTWYSCQIVRSRIFTCGSTRTGSPRLGNFNSSIIWYCYCMQERCRPSSTDLEWRPDDGTIWTQFVESSFISRRITWETMLCYQSQDRIKNRWGRLLSLVCSQTIISETSYSELWDTGWRTINTGIKAVMKR